MSHHHDSHAHHHEEAGAGMRFREKMETLFVHWIKHNSDHAQTYEDWAEKAAAENLHETAGVLKEIAALTRTINEKFEQGRALVAKEGAEG